MHAGGNARLVPAVVCLVAGLQTNAILPVTHGPVPSARIEMKAKDGSGLQLNSANPWSRSTEKSLSASRVGAPAELMKAIGGVNATSRSADRAARTGDQ